MIKVYLFLIIMGVIGGVGYGGYIYYKDTQQRIQTLAENGAKAEHERRWICAISCAIWETRMSRTTFFSTLSMAMPPTFGVSRIESQGAVGCVCFWAIDRGVCKSA